jgi:Rrf2 family nitric oxide-sensitive transcriptional repressor
VPFSQQTVVGLRVMMRLALADERRATVARVARALGVGERAVGDAVRDLSAWGYVRATRGRSGGIAATEAGRALTVGQLARLLEAPMPRDEGAAPDIASRLLEGALRAGEAARYAELDRHTFGVLAASLQAKPLRLFAIEASGADLSIRPAS